MAPLLSKCAGAAVAVAVTLVVTGCGGSGDDSGAAPVTSPDDIPTTATGTDRCLPASPAAISAIESGLEPGASLRDVYIVRSRDYNKAYFVSANIEGAPGGEQIATWAVTDPEPDGTLVFSVTEPAKRLSDFSDAGGSFSGIDDGVSESQECVGGESLAG